MTFVPCLALLPTPSCTNGKTHKMARCPFAVLRFADGRVCILTGQFYPCGPEYHYIFY